METKDTNKKSFRCIVITAKMIIGEILVGLLDGKCLECGAKWVPGVSFPKFLEDWNDDDIGKLNKEIDRKVYSLLSHLHR